MPVWSNKQNLKENLLGYLEFSSQEPHLALELVNCERTLKQF